jgi:F-type H+-transporting ATPase subunit delta
VSAVSEAAARVYAKALFELGLEEGDTGAIGEDLHAVEDALNGLEGDLRAFFNLPQLRRDDKRRIINLAFAGKVGRPVLGLLNVLVEKRREALFHEGRLQVQVTSARKLDDDVAAALRRAIEQRTNKSVVLQQRVDPAVIGGLKVNVGDRVIDGTMRRALQDMRRTLAATKL